MAHVGLTQRELAQRAGLNPQTVKHLLGGQNPQPHARTLHKLAAGLGVSVDELFRGAPPRGQRRFDRQTNPVVDCVLADHPRLCASWTQDDFDELYSQFGSGGALTYEGALALIERINRARCVQQKAAVLLQTEYADLLGDFVELLYRRVQAQPGRHRGQPGTSRGPKEGIGEC
jgi:transcriptional regulator with XRE-family HTH domain